MDLCLCLIVQYVLLFINVLNTERAKRVSKKYVAPYKLPDRFALINILSAALFLIAKYTIIMFCPIKKQDDIHPQKRLSL